MRKNGFAVGRYNPCTYFHKQRGLVCLVHGDDFVTTGSREDCKWLKGRLENRFEIKTKVIGAGGEEEREERILNRIIRLTKNGWELEADQRHVDIMVDQMNFKGAKGVATPCEEDQEWEQEENRELLNEIKARGFRG